MDAEQKKKASMILHSLEDMSTFVTSKFLALQSKFFP